jgi:RNA polymerase sigma-70 factor (ECF subfamily)
MFFFGMASDAEEWSNALCESCLGEIAAHDKNALGALYENTKNAVYGFALSIVRNTQDAEDVLQDTFVSIYASARNYKRMGKPMAWILTITRNLSLMKIRDRQKTSDISEDEWRFFAADEASVTSEDRLALTAALEKISPEESQIVMLHAVAGFKHREVAEVLELPLSTVLSKYNRAVKKLKSVLEETGAHAE